MARVEMLHQMSGGRADGSPWPDVNDVLECEDDEAAHLVRAQIARWPADGAVPPAAAAAPVPAGDEPPEPEDGSDDDSDDVPDDDPNRPGVRAAKQEWVDYASRYRGCHPVRAAEMTKADLIAEFGKQAAS